MMVKWPFKRNNQETDTTVPPEIQEYYQAERRERVGMAWLLAAGTLVATVLLAFGMFYGGRWAYRTLFTDDSQQTGSQVEQGIEDFGQDNQATGDQDIDRDEDLAPDTDSEPATLPGDSTDEPAEEETPTQTPRTGPTDLPSTGPSSNL